MQQSATTAKGLYSKLESKRDPFLRRAWDAADLTVPSLLPREGTTSSTKFKTPFQSLGSRGLNNLASKLLMALMPPNAPFFRLRLDDPEIEQLVEQNEQKADLEEALSQIERKVTKEIEKSAIRVGVNEALKHLILSGNALIYVRPEGGVRVFHLDQYVVQRDPAGQVLDIVVKESVSRTTLPKEVQAALDNKDNSGGDTKDQQPVEMYTHVTRGTESWQVHQEVDGVVIPSSKGTYPLEKTPWIALRFIQVDGENYGRGFVEEYYGDLRSLEGLTKAIVEGSAAASKILFFVAPNGTTKASSLVDSPNGAVRTGSAADVSVLQADKRADFSIAYQTIGNIEERLSYAFLLNSAVQRNAERVTAEEIRYMASELESALGGVYSILSQEFQLPLVRRLVFQLEKNGEIPSLPEGSVEPSITTGVEALGRGHDLDKLDQFLAGLQKAVPPEILSQYINFPDYMTRRATALGIETGGLIRSEQEVQQQQQAAQQAQAQQQMQQQMAQQAMQTGGKVIEKATPQQ